MQATMRPSGFARRGLRRLGRVGDDGDGRDWCARVRWRYGRMFISDQRVYELPLSVDTAGLRRGADDSVAIASALSTHSGGESNSGSQPSHAGTVAFYGAVDGVRTRQSRRVERYADDLLTGADAYDATDAQSGGALAETV